MRQRRYTSDLTDEQWAILGPLLPWPVWLDGGGGRPEEYCRRQVIDAIFYVDDNGCKWRNLPADFPPWRTVHAAFTRWWVSGDVLAVHNDLRDLVRAAEGRDPDPTAAIIDSQSVRAAETVGAGSRGFDAGKKINGRTRHVVVDTTGLLLVVAVTAASVQDRDGARLVLQRIRQLFHTIALVWADGAYAGKLVVWAKQALRITIEIVKRGDDTSGFVVLPRRWVVERSLSWLSGSRRLARDYERLPVHHEALVHWSMILLMTRRLARAPRHRATVNSPVAC
ncbi:IS5 family transposase [Nocardia sp. alder85J]|uniref:IS5 family transposase n=1 Tax=Nocardia sp. alder85J TaxID=2862949 RepID=UPI001CD3BE29|nr:IS5 family transposase [Nocardia sp. alder85J]MCX4094499.1 IS5 family transposase [Nocardia sp. alder85J]MCX4094540.1 IS5 family transposase [Nocardia sp. alder85J]MCX4098409.1 IS5 family transposase [Nocardia sp. alder85J]